MLIVMIIISIIIMLINYVNVWRPLEFCSAPNNI